MKSSLNSGPEGKSSSFLQYFGFHRWFFFASKAKVAGKLMDKAWNRDDSTRNTTHCDSDVNDKNDFLNCIQMFKWMFPKIEVPPNHPFNRVFQYKPSILGYPYFWKHPNVQIVGKGLFFEVLDKQRTPLVWPCLLLMSNQQPSLK